MINENTANLNTTKKLPKERKKREKIYTERFELRLSIYEAKILREAAAEYNLTPSDYIRIQLNNTNVKLLSAENIYDRKGLINEINHIGVNINQIVKNHNSHMYSDYEKKKLFAMMKKVWDLLENKLNKEI